MTHCFFPFVCEPVCTLMYFWLLNILAHVARGESRTLFAPLPSGLSRRLQDYATMQFCANKLDKKDFFGKSDPFMVFYRSNEDGT